MAGGPGPSSQQAPAEEGGKKDEKPKGEQNVKTWLVDKSLGSAANLSKLLPTGTTLAFQTMAPAFTKGGECVDHDVNFWFTWGLIGFLTLLCALLSFTDSVTDRDGVTYYGRATCDGFKLFNRKLSELNLFDEGEVDKPKRLEELKKSKRLNKRDYLHAIVSAAVFMALAFCDAGVQKCLVPTESKHWNMFLGNMPLAVGFLAGFLFMVFPSTRNGIGDDGPPPAPPSPAGTKKTLAAGANCDSSLTTMDDVTQVVAPPTRYEIDQVV